MEEVNFDKVPSEIDTTREESPYPTVDEEIRMRQGMLFDRNKHCKIISPFRQRKKQQLPFTYKYFCICPRYNPNYCCKHAGNVIIDRDVLTKEEHICFLATPKDNFAGLRGRPRFLQKKLIYPNCTTRIEELAAPKEKRVKQNLEEYKHLLTKRHFDSLKERLKKKPDVVFTSIPQALSYVDEERRLNRVARNMEKQRCRRMKKNIVRKQRRQIRKIICVLFEEMKDFLLNDQFLIDSKSTLCAVILAEIRDFTDKEFYSTGNLHEYQQVLANNLTVWINKFIEGLNIHMPPPPLRIQPPEPENYLPLQDYISCTECEPEEEQEAEYECEYEAKRQGECEGEYERDGLREGEGQEEEVHDNYYGRSGTIDEYAEQTTTEPFDMEPTVLSEG